MRQLAYSELRTLTPPGTNNYPSRQVSLSLKAKSTQRWHLKGGVRASGKPRFIKLWLAA